MDFKQAHSSNFKTGRTSEIKYIVIHYTSNNGDTAKNNVDYFASSKNLSASAHYFVDENTVWQSVKDADTAWHCGAKTYKHSYCRNANSIGIELCSRKDGSGNYYFKDETVKNAAELTKTLMAKYNIPSSNVIRHYDVTGKTCPAPFVIDEAQWNKFKDMISAPAKKLETGNDIVWELMNGKYKVEIIEAQRAVAALDKAKNNQEFMSLYWILYKLVNGSTDAVSNSATAASNATTTKKEIEPYTYHIEGITHIIECDPMSIKNVETQMATNKTDVKNFVNGTFFMMQANGKAYPLGITANEGRVFSNYITHNKPVATLIVYADGTVAMKYISDITKESNIRFAVSGYSVHPKITATEEGFTGAFSDVTRATNRPIIGYRKSDNKIVIAVRSSSSASRANQTAKNLGLDFAISLDAGGSTTLKVDNNYKFKGDGRKIWGGITWS